MAVVAWRWSMGQGAVKHMPSSITDLSPPYLMQPLTTDMGDDEELSPEQKRGIAANFIKLSPPAQQLKVVEGALASVGHGGGRVEMERGGAGVVEMGQGGVRLGCLRWNEVG